MPLRTFALPSFCYLYRLKKQKCGEKKNYVLLQELRGTVGEELGAPITCIAEADKLAFTRMFVSKYNLKGVCSADYDHQSISTTSIACLQRLEKNNLSMFCA